MPVPISSATMADLLDPRFRELSLGEFEAHPDMVPELYSVKDADRDTERVTGLSPMGDFSEYTGTLAYDGQTQGYDVTETHKQFALGIQIERTFYDDSQFDVIDDLFKGLGRSAHKTRQKHASRIFTSSFSNDTFFYTHSEAVALCSNSHTTTVSGVTTANGFDNLATGALSPVSLTTMITQFRKLRDLAGEPIDESPTELWIPIDLQDRAGEIIKTVEGLDTSSGTKNPHYQRLTVKPWVRLTDVNDFWLTSEKLRKDSLRWYERIPLEIAKMESFDQFIAKGRAYMRYGVLYRYHQFVVGAQVT